MWKTLRQTLNFGDSASLLADRREKLAAVFGVSSDLYRNFESTTFRQFASHLVTTRRSPCQPDGDQMPAIDGASLPEFLRTFRTLVGMITIESRDGTRQQLVDRFLDELPNARRVSREILGSGASAELQYRLIVDRVTLNGWKRYCSGLRDRKHAMRLRTLNVPLMLAAQDGWTEQDLSIEVRMPAGVSMHPGDPRRTESVRHVLRFFSREVRRIERSGDWETVLRPGRSRNSTSSGEE
jgi:hypothetical protein